MQKLKKNNFSSLLIGFILLIQINNVAGQIKSGEVIYNVTTNPKIIFRQAKMPIEMQKFMSKVNGFISTLNFKLLFNSKLSNFSINNDMNIDDFDSYQRMAIFYAHGNNRYFTYQKEKLVVKETFFLGKNYLVQIPLKGLTWKLINEQKKIGSYLCNKAIATLDNVSESTGKKISTTYIAWYAPDINFNYGPLEISGLPGLVLEFTNGYIIYSASKINFSQKTVSIKKPKKGEIITDDDFKKLGKKTFEEHGFTRK